MIMKNVVIVGASRGLGYEMAQAFGEKSDYQVFATTRSPLHSHPHIHTLTLDMRDTSSIKQAASQIDSIDTLIINGAIGEEEDILNTSIERVQEYLNVNTIGPLRIVKEFLPSLLKRQTRQIIFMSSIVAFPRHQVDSPWGFHGAYSVSKAALNMVFVQLHRDLKDEGFTVVGVDPGWVDTDMGRLMGDGGISCQQAGEMVVGVIDKLSPSDSGNFYTRDGSIVQW